LTESVVPTGRDDSNVGVSVGTRRRGALEVTAGPTGPSCDVNGRVRRRALLLWPRLDRAGLARTAGDPRRVARLVARRSALPPEMIVAMLMAGGDPD
jgi:hypothetical protein